MATRSLLRPEQLDSYESFYFAQLELAIDGYDDGQVILSRDGNGNMTFKDVFNETVTLSSLVSGGFDIARLILTVGGTLVYIDDGEIVLKPE